jgi:hypothetical protein
MNDEGKKADFLGDTGGVRRLYHPKNHFIPNSLYYYINPSGL